MYGLVPTTWAGSGVLCNNGGSLVGLQPFVTVIIPVYNVAEQLSECLRAIGKSSYSAYEVIVVDDASSDGSLDVARTSGIIAYGLPRKSGPAAARNLGARYARGDILFFIDSDVLIQRDTIERLMRNFTEGETIAAVFGSYDDDPPQKNFFSQYKNLLHHFIHQSSCKEAGTFWAGCGAIRKSLFTRLGGFNEKAYQKPCIEDIELGYRIKAAGYRIILDKDLQVKHLKRWSFKSLILTDIFARAIPWTKLIRDRHVMVDDLNLQMSQKASAALACLVALILPVLPFHPILILLALACLAIVLGINHGLFRLFLNRNGWKFAACAFGMHLLYYLYSTAAFALYSAFYWNSRDCR